MRFTPLVLALILPLPIAAQARVIDHTKARMFLNEDVIVEGPVARVDRAARGALWFSLGKPHPSSTVVIVVPAEFANAFPDPRSYEGATVRAHGRLTTGEDQGLSGGPALSGPKPRSPFIVLEDASKLIVVTPSKPPQKP